MIKVLVVDDEPQILRALGINLRARGYDVAVAARGAEALRVAATQQPELVVLDLGLPDLDGLDVIHGLRGWTAVPIIVLSGRSGSSDKVAALDAGADDYVTKPFGVDELLARIRAVTRRAAGQASAGATVTIGRWQIQLADRVVCGTEGTEQVRLTPTEWKLLEILVQNPGKLVSQRQLLQEVWGPQYGVRPTICASTWRSCATSSRTTPPTRVTCSLSQAWAIGCTSMRASSPARIDHRPSSARAAPTWSASRQATLRCSIVGRAMCVDAVSRNSPCVTLALRTAKRISESVGSP